MKTEYYSIKQESLASCLDHCSLKGNDGWWYLPDIQRRFVWSAKATLQLIDSLFRGWPFGILTVQKTKADDSTTIPSRKFLRKTGNSNEGSKTYSVHEEFSGDEEVCPNVFYLVLDGQQRMQSILFAFAEGQGIGYVQTEDEWMKDLWGWKLRKKRNVDYQVCPSASMYIDFEKLLFALDATDAAEANFSAIRYMDDGAICYMVSDSFHSPYYDRDPDWPFPVRKKIKGDACLRLNKLWGFCQELDKRIMSTKEVARDAVKNMLPTMWMASKWNLDKTILENNSEELVDFVSYFYTTVYQLEIGRVELEKPETGVGDEAFQHEVVEIFTRLNHGGTPLTTGEITGAWLKNYWSGTEQPDNVIENLKNKCLENGFDLPNFIRFASALWTIAGDNFDQRKIIQNKDLTNAKLLKQLAEWLSKNWPMIYSATIEVAKDFLDKRWFTQAEGFSACPLAVLVAFRMRVNEKLTGLNEKEKAEFLRKTIDELSSIEFRFLACSQWSGYWNLDTIERWAKKWQAESNNPIELLEATLNNHISKMAIDSFHEIDARNRGQVRRYYSYLLVWHRLNKKRYEVWRSNIAKPDLHVDHCVSFAKWLKLLNLEKSRITVEENEKCQELINSIGNCILLNSSTNIGKGEQPFKEYFGWLWEEASKEGKDALGIRDSLASPQLADIETVRQDIQDREKDIRDELNKFMRGDVEVVT